jgi:undecaprenyl-diphosphatase
METHMPLTRFLALTLIGLALSLLSILLLDYPLAPKVAALHEGHEVLWEIITGMGDSKYMGLLMLLLWVIAFVLGKKDPSNPLFPTLRAKAIIIVAAVIGTGVTVMILKVIVGRPRPYTGEIAFSPFTFGSAHASWPSGHTTSAFAFAVALGMAFPKLRWPMLVVAVLAGFSRMVLNKHYLGDVIMGATIGTLGAVLIYNWLRPKLGLKT